MKKLTATICIFLACAISVAANSGQSLTNNEYFRRSLELERLSKEAFEYGDYDAAAAYAIQSREYAEMSDLYVAQMLLKRDAETLYQQAEARYSWAGGPEVEAATRYPDQYRTATLSIEEAKIELANESYDKAIGQLTQVLAALEGLSAIPVFPAYYTVQFKESLTDCLWRIAELPFVYNDPERWPELYRANRANMPQPDNPDLVRPGMVLRIPALAGEKREGTWQAGTAYPVFGSDNP